MTFIVALNLVSLIASIVSIYANARIIKILKETGSSPRPDVGEGLNPETYLAEKLHELQTMKFSDMTRRIK